MSAATAAKFKLLKSIGSPSSTGTLGSDCSKWPSIGAKAFIKPSGGGGITRADVVVATEDVTVYRAIRATADHQVFINTYGRPEPEIETFLTKCRPASW